MSYARLLSAWLILAVAMPLNGAFRELWLKTRLDHGLADLISAIFGVLIILVVTAAIFRIPRDAAVPRLATMSLLLVGLTVAFEFTFGLIEGRSVRELVANYAFWDGRLWPLVLLTLAATPFIWRGRERTPLD